MTGRRAHPRCPNFAATTSRATRQTGRVRPDMPPLHHPAQHTHDTECTAVGHSDAAALRQGAHTPASTAAPAAAAGAWFEMLASSTRW